jgi:hypothetical protein
MLNLKEHDGVVLNQDSTGNGPKKGAVGTIVHVFTHPRLAYEVEFCDKDGRTLVQLSLTPDQIMPHWPGRGSTGQA